MHRSHVLDLIDAYGQRWPEESPTVDRFREFVRTEPDCFERTLAKGHITASSWLVDGSGRNVLLTHHRKLNRWLQLGGHADGDTNPLNVAMREAEEESGLSALEPVEQGIFDLDIHAIPARKNDPEHFHYDIRFAIRHRGDESFTVSEESHDLAWVKIDHIEDYTDEPSMLRMAAKWRVRGILGRTRKLACR